MSNRRDDDLERELRAHLELEAEERIAGGMSETDARRLEDRFVRQGAGARHDAHATRLVNEARHDADLARARRDDAGAVGADEAAWGRRERRQRRHGGEARPLRRGARHALRCGRPHPGRDPDRGAGLGARLRRHDRDASGRAHPVDAGGARGRRLVLAAAASGQALRRRGGLLRQAARRWAGAWPGTA